jgi:hypothetical protein
MPHWSTSGAFITKTCQNVNAERCRIMCKQRGANTAAPQPSAGCTCLHVIELLNVLTDP